MNTQRLKAGFAGLLAANSLPHLASAAAGHEHLTPLAGKHSSPTVNLVWGAANLLGGLVLLRSSLPPSERRWDRTLVAFDTGVALFALWMAGAEAFLHVNTPQNARSSED